MLRYKNVEASGKKIVRDGANLGLFLHLQVQILVKPTHIFGKGFMTLDFAPL